MALIKKLVDLLKPFKELITILVFLAGSGYAAITYFATAQQLSRATKALEEQQGDQHAATLAAMDELKCLTRLNRNFLRAEIEEFRFSTLLEKNLTKSDLLRDQDSEFARLELASLDVNRDSITEKLRSIEAEKRRVILSLQNASCSSST